MKKLHSDFLQADKEGKISLLPETGTRFIKMNNNFEKYIYCTLELIS